jgi:hypothetical protein
MVEASDREEEVVAYALVDLMLARGVSSEQADLAADLYEWSRLPLDPAAILLADPRRSFLARRRAVSALRRTWYEERFQRLALGAVCEIAARAAGVEASRTPVATPAAAGALLNDDEMEFLSTLLFALESGASAEAAGPRLRIRDYIPPDNPIARYIRGSSSIW